MFNLKYLIASSINSSPILSTYKSDYQTETRRRSFLANFQTLNRQFSVKTVKTTLSQKKQGEVSMSAVIIQPERWSRRNDLQQKSKKSTRSGPLELAIIEQKLHQ